MDHHEAVRKFEHLMLKSADQAQEAATELEALVSLLPNEKSRQLAQLQVKASHKQANEFRELAQRVKEHWRNLIESPCVEKNGVKRKIEMKKTLRGINPASKPSGDGCVE